jgi:hypothetical protein
MNNLTNIILTKVANLPDAIVNVANNLLRYILPKDDVVAQTCRKVCGSCRRVNDIEFKRTCRICCASFPAVGCYAPFVEVCAYRV